jgi:hypothetical protein
MIIYWAVTAVRIVPGQRVAVRPVRRHISGERGPGQQAETMVPERLLDLHKGSRAVQFRVGIHTIVIMEMIMRRSALVGATFPADGLMHTAVNAGLSGASPGAVVRYLAYLAAGLDEGEARARIMPTRTPLAAFENRSMAERVDVPHEIRDAIRAKHPGKPISWVLRYYMALVNGASERQARSIADGFKAGRPVGSKDSRPRIRRTSAAITAVREAVAA